MAKVRKTQRSENGKRIVSLILAFNDHGDGTESFSGPDHPKRLKCLAKSSDEVLENSLLTRLTESIDGDETGDWINNLPDTLAQYCVEQDLLQEEEGSTEEPEEDGEEEEFEEEEGADEEEEFEESEDDEETEEEMSESSNESDDLDETSDANASDEEQESDTGSERSEEDDSVNADLAHILEDSTEAKDALADFISAKLDAGYEIRLSAKKIACHHCCKETKDLMVPVEKDEEAVAAEKPKTSPNKTKLFARVIGQLEETKVPGGTMRALLQNELNSLSLRKKFAEAMQITIPGGIENATGKKLAYALPKWADETYGAPLEEEEEE